MSTEKGLQKVTFIIDEAQSTWELSNMFWTDLVLPCLKWETGPSFCFFSSCDHDNKSTRASRAFSLVTKYPPSNPLFYRHTEYNDIVNAFCTHPTTTIFLDPSARSHLYQLTKGHPNVVQSIVVFIDKVSRANHDASARRQVGLDEIKVMLSDDDQLFRSGQLRRAMYGKLLPSQIWNPFKDIFCKVLSEGKIEYCPSDDIYGKRLEDCYKKGILFSESEDSSPKFLVFPSPLHQRYVKWYYKL